MLGFLLLPAAVFQFILYRQNLAVAREGWTLATPLQKSDRLLVVAPHCDDETLGAGGTIAVARQSHSRVQIVFLTNGDGSRSTQLVAEAREVRSHLHPRRWLGEKSAAESKNLFQRIAAMRQREALAACQKLGVGRADVIFLGYPDGGTQAMWQTNWSPQAPFLSPYTKTARSPYQNAFTPRATYAGSQVVRDLEKIIEKFRPTQILTTHPEDTHPDHWAAYAYTAAALEHLRLSNAESTRATAGRARLRTFLVHHGIWPAPHGYHPDEPLLPPASLQQSGARWLSEPLSRAARSAKKDALEQYTSQLVWTPHYLRSFLRRNEIFDDAPQRATRAASSEIKLSDPACDSAWREVWPAADIQSLQVEQDKRVLALRVGLAQTPSPRVKYRCALHVVTAQKTMAWKIVVRRDGSQMQAKMIALQDNGNQARETSVPIRFTPDGFVLDMPRATFVKANAPATLLWSASTHAGRTRFDQTATIVAPLAKDSVSTNAEKSDE